MTSTNPNALARLERNRKALRLRIDGRTYESIASECGFNSRHAARKAVVTLLQREVSDEIAVLRAVYRSRIESLLGAIWQAATDPSEAIRTARSSGSPDPIAQDKAVLLAIRLLESEARVDGVFDYEAPAQPSEATARVDVFRWEPSPEWMRQYAAVLRDAGLLDDGDEPVALLASGE